MAPCLSSSLSGIDLKATFCTQFFQSHSVVSSPPILPSQSSFGRCPIEASLRKGSCNLGKKVEHTRTSWTTSNSSEQAWSGHALRCSRRDEEHSNEDFHSSPIVQQEFVQLVRDLSILKGMVANYMSYNLKQKRLFVRKSQDFWDKFRIFITRYQLSDDESAKRAVHGFNVKLLEANTNWQIMFERSQTTLAAVKNAIELESRLIGDPALDPAPVQSPMQRLTETRQVALRHLGPRQVGALAALQQHIQEEPRHAQLLSDPNAVAALTDMLTDKSRCGKYLDKPAYLDLFLAIRNILEHASESETEPETEPEARQEALE